ncbi:MAG: hypothetical protein Q4G08_04830, partial [Capnocytophaga sp.]|nr:hypothetical protein [Capnocytophaga sp.]
MKRWILGFVLTAMATVLQAQTTFSIPYENNFRTTADFSRAETENFVLSNVTRGTGAGGYATIPLNGYIETSEFDIASGETHIEIIFYTASFGNGSNRKLTVSFDENNETVDVAASTTYSKQTVLIPINSAVKGKIKFEMTGGTGSIRFRDLKIDYATITPIVTPTLTVTPAKLENLDYEETKGASDYKTFTLSGENLSPESGNLTLTIPSDFEISVNGIVYSQTHTLNYTSGTVSETVQVRLAAGLAVGTYSGAIEISGGTATATKVDVSGEVTAATVTPTVPEISVPYENGLRNETDWDRAINEGFAFDRSKTRTQAGGYVHMSVGESFTSPKINVQNITSIDIAAELATYGGRTGGQEVTLFYSTDGTNFIAVNTETYKPVDPDTYLETKETIDV